MSEKSSVLVRVADPDHFDAGLSLSFRFDADRDPFTLFYVDQNLNPHLILCPALLLQSHKHIF